MNRTLIKISFKHHFDAANNQTSNGHASFICWVNALKKSCVDDGSGLFFDYETIPVTGLNSVYHYYHPDTGPLSDIGHHYRLVLICNVSEWHCLLQKPQKLKAAAEVMRAKTGFECR
jgi:hypothetical protein